MYLPIFGRGPYWPTHNMFKTKVVWGCIMFRTWQNLATTCANFRDFPHKAFPWLHASVYTGPIEYSDLPKMETIIGDLEKLAERKRYINEVKSYWRPFTEYLHTENSSLAEAVSSGNISFWFSKFLFSVRGRSSWRAGRAPKKMQLTHQFCTH